MFRKCKCGHNKFESVKVVCAELTVTIDEDGDMIDGEVFDYQTPQQPDEPYEYFSCLKCRNCYTYEEMFIDRG